MSQQTFGEDPELARGLESRCKLMERQEQGHRSNNNDDYCEDHYSSSLADLSSGRLSEASHESAFSSSGSECDDSSSSSSAGQSDSASGSSSGSPAEPQKALNSSRNLMPELAEALELVERVRGHFLERLQEESRYEPSDLDAMKLPLPELGLHEQSLAFRFISRYVNFPQSLAEPKLAQKEIREATLKLEEFLSFRRQFRIPAARADHFAREFYLLSGVFPFGHDRCNLPVLYLRARVHRRWSQRLDESFRRYVAWQVNELTKSYAGAKVAKSIGSSGLDKDGSFGICFDCLHVSYSHLDMDFLRYLVRLLVQYYPTYCRYALCVDLPWLFRSVWKLVRSWLPEEARNTVQLITSKQLGEYIDERQVPNSMRANDLDSSEKPIECRHQLPDNWANLCGIEEFAEELNLTAAEIKQFKNHVKKVRAEDEQLGA